MRLHHRRRQDDQEARQGDEHGHDSPAEPMPAGHLEPLDLLGESIALGLDPLEFP